MFNNPDVLCFNGSDSEDATLETMKVRAKREFKVYKQLVKGFFSKGGKMELASEVNAW